MSILLSTDLVVNLAMGCKNIDLTPFTPYMEKFAGYPLQRGKLLLDLSYDIAHGKLDASQHVIITGMTLGARNNSTNATISPSNWASPCSRTARETLTSTSLFTATLPIRSSAFCPSSGRS